MKEFYFFKITTMSGRYCIVAMDKWNDKRLLISSALKKLGMGISGTEVRPGCPRMSIGITSRLMVRMGLTVRQNHSSELALSSERFGGNGDTDYFRANPSVQLCCTDPGTPRKFQ
eukprot:5457300-Amphidinium_carterae.1